MAFGNKALPTRKYAYDVATLGDPNIRDRWGRRVPFEGYDQATEQLDKAHAYQKKLVEIELERRKDASRIVHDGVPGLREALADADAKKAALELARSQLAASNIANRKKNTDKTLKALVKQRKAESKAAWDAYKAARSAAYKEASVRPLLDQLEAAYRLRRVAARDEAVEGGLYWATANTVATRVSQKGKPPKMPAWGDGVLSVQVQRKGVKGSERVPVLDRNGNPKIGPTGKPVTRAVDAVRIGAAEITNSTNTLVRLQKCERPDGKPTKLWWVYFRVGSDAKGGPVWAKLPTYYHRPLHPEGDIKWVRLVRRQTGDHFRWQVQFDLARPSWSDPDPRRATTGTVAVALGWRKIDGDVRVAVWAGSDGETGEVRIPADRLGQWEMCDRLRSLRDQQFNADREVLADWLVGRDLTPEWQQQMCHLGKWRSPRRLTRFVRWWRRHRLPGDDEVFARLNGERVVNPDPKTPADGTKYRYTGGARQEKHLNDWQQYGSLHLREWRKWHYRQIATALSRRYATAVVADIDWHELGKNGEVEEDDKVSKTNRGRAAVAKFRTELEYRMRAVKGSAAYVTRTCHRCGEVCPSPKAARWVTCERCGGAKIDRALNAAHNLLKQAQEAGAGQ